MQIFNLVENQQLNKTEIPGNCLNVRRATYRVGIYARCFASPLNWTHTLTTTTLMINTSEVAEKQTTV